jgi:SAM-dependent methyltransferase
MRRLRTHTKWLLRYYGWQSLVPTVVATVFPAVRRQGWYVRWKEQAFDRRFGVATAGLVAIEALDIAETLRRHAVEYSPTPGAALGVVLDELGINHRDFTFVDLGCGKGRALLMAAAFPFARIIGVEISKALCDAARANIAKGKIRYRVCQRIECVQASATDFEFPTTPLVVYCFNPFGAEVLSQVLERLTVSAASQPRQVIAIYCNPVHRLLFDDSDAWRSRPLRNGAAPAGWAVYQSPIGLKPVAAADQTEL